MIVVRNKWIPFGSFAAINILGVVFSKVPLGMADRNHEYIHTLQQREMLFVLFYLVYVVEWSLHYYKTRDWVQAYYRISFEREAYANQNDLSYARHRHLWAWTKYF